MGLDLRVSAITVTRRTNAARAVVRIRNCRTMWHSRAYRDPRRVHARIRVIPLPLIDTVHNVAFHTSQCVSQSIARPPRAKLVCC